MTRQPIPAGLIADLHESPEFWHMQSYLDIDATVQALIAERDALRAQVELDRTTRESKQEASS